MPEPSNPGIEATPLPTTFVRVNGTADKLRQWFAVIVALLAITGTGYVALHDIAQLQADVKSIQSGLGRMQLDVALICAKIVSDEGGDPRKECQTSRGD